MLGKVHREPRTLSIFKGGKLFRWLCKEIYWGHTIHSAASSPRWMSSQSCSITLEGQEACSDRYETNTGYTWNGNIDLALNWIGNCSNFSDGNQIPSWNAVFLRCPCISASVNGIPSSLSSLAITTGSGLQKTHGFRVDWNDLCNVCISRTEYLFWCILPVEAFSTDMTKWLANS